MNGPTESVFIAETLKMTPRCLPDSGIPSV
jgi:hypothetical protein